MRLTFSEIFPLIPIESYVVTIRCNRLEETIPTNGHIIEIN